MSESEAETPTPVDSPSTPSTPTDSGPAADESVQTDEPVTADNSPSSDNSLFSIAFTPQLLLMALLALLGLLLVCTFGVLLLDPLGWLDKDGEETVVILTPAGNGLLPDPDGADAIVIFDGSSSLSIDMDPPSGIDLNGTTIPVRAQFVTEAGSWESDVADGRVAEWVFGTIVNPVFGLSSSQENELLLQKLVPGDRIKVNYISGESREFLVSGRELVSVLDGDLFAQNRPGVTLLWLGGNRPDSRLVVYGEYTLPETTTNEIEDNRLADIGEPVTFGNLAVTVDRADMIGSNGVAPPGFSIYHVDFTLDNQGNNTLDSGLLRISLKDNLGNQYSMNAAAAVNGTHPVLTGFVSPNSRMSATAAFQIPANLGGDTLEWRVNRVDIPGEVVVGLPFGGSTSRNASVTLNTADVSEDGGTLIVSGSVVNNGSQAFQVNATDVSLSENGTVYLVFATTPGFPWSVPPGQVVNFSLTFQRPVGSAATFSLLNNSFELNGIR